MVENCDFVISPLAFDASVSGSPSEYCHTDMVGLTDGEKNFKDMYNHLDTIPACDGQADGQTFCHGIVRTMHTRRAVIKYHI